MHYFWRGAPTTIFNGTSEQRHKAREKFCLRSGDLGLSVFEVSSEEDRDLVVAALACTKTDDDRMPYLELEVSDISPFALIIATPGDTVVPRANLLHRELRCSQEKLFALADDLIDKGKRARPFGRIEVRACLLRLGIGEVDDEQARDWLSKFQQRHKG